MQLRKIMTHEVEVVHPDATLDTAPLKMRAPNIGALPVCDGRQLVGVINASLQEAAQRMKGLDIGPLPVCTGKQLEGMPTDRDITVRAVAEGRGPRTTRVHEVMTRDVVYAFDDQDVTEAARLMEEHQIRRIVVLDRNKQLAGIVCLGDLAVHTGNERQAGKTLERVSEPSEPNRQHRIDIERERLRHGGGHLL